MIRRLECVLEPTRDAVQARHKALVGTAVDLYLMLPKVAGANFYNTSQYTLDSTSTRANLEKSNLPFTLPTQGSLLARAR